MKPAALEMWCKPDYGYGALAKEQESQSRGALVKSR
jgi:hypothetical protein